MTDLIEDSDLGKINLRYSSLARSISFRITPKGEFVATAPKHTPKLIIKQVIRSSKNDLLRMVQQRSERVMYDHDQEIGKSHHLSIVRSKTATIDVTLSKREITAKIPHDLNINDALLQDTIRANVIKALRREAKAYLPRRLEVLAKRLGYRYSSVRFSHASSRWGSCSSNGTISLNIALMKLPLELIDYVIIHELCHTVQMNHSTAFWSNVAKHDDLYKLHRRQLKKHTPEL